MKSKKILKIASVFVLASTLAACGEKVTTKDYEKWAVEHGYVYDPENNGYISETNTKPWFEVTFSSTVTEIGATELLALINEEYGSNLVVFYGRNNNGEATKETADFLTVANNFVEESKYKIYYFNYDKSYATGDAALTAENVAKASVMEKLGIQTTDTEAKLITFIEGEKKTTTAVKTMKNVAGLEKTLRIDFKLENNVVTETHEITSIEELQTLVASGKQFLLFAGRKTCPDCKKMADPSRDAVLNKLFRDYEGAIYLMYSDYVTEAELSAIEKMEDMCEAKYYGCSTPGQSLTVVLQRELKLYRSILGLNEGAPAVYRAKYIKATEWNTKTTYYTVDDKELVYTKVATPVETDLANYYVYDGYNAHYLVENKIDQFDTIYAQTETAVAASTEGYASLTADQKRVLVEKALFEKDCFTTTAPAYVSSDKWVGKFIASYWDIPALFVINASAADIEDNEVAQTICDSIASSPIYTRNPAAEGFEPAGVSQFPSYFANAISPRSGQIMDTPQNVESIYQNTLNWALSWLPYFND